MFSLTLIFKLNDNLWKPILMFSFAFGLCGIWNTTEPARRSRAMLAISVTWLSPVIDWFIYELIMISITPTNISWHSWNNHEVICHSEDIVNIEFCEPCFRCARYSTSKQWYQDWNEQTNLKHWDNFILTISCLVSRFV